MEYPLLIVSDPGNVYNVARFPLGSAKSSSSSSSSSSKTSLFQNANVTLEEMNVGEDGKLAEEGAVNSDDEAEAAALKRAQPKPAYGQRSKIPLMRRARERKWILKDEQGKEKFSGIIDGSTSDETFVCFCR